MIKEVEISSCCEIVSGSTPSRIIPDYWGGDINWFTPKDLSNLVGKFVDEAPEKITEQGYKSCSTNLLPPFSLMLSSRAPIGHLAINTVPACTNQGFKSLVPKSNTDVNYLYYAIKRIIPMLQDLGNGATFKELSKSTLAKVKIPLPPLETQKRIAEILDAADTLRQKTKTLIEKYDQLTQSLFLDMFGDPVNNSHGWDIEPIHNLIAPVDKIDRGFYQSQINYIDISSIDNTSHEICNITRHITSERPSRAQQILRKGDILLSTVRPNLKNIAVNHTDDAIASTGFFIIRSNEKIESKFFFEVIKTDSITNKLVGLTSGANYPAIKSSDVKNINIPLPPLPLQNQFAERVQAIEVQKAKAQASLEKSEELFQSLLQRAFKGEID